MAVSRPRTRIVYFRLTEEEFHQLSTLCMTTEAGRSISELSREAVRQVILHNQLTQANNSEPGESSEAFRRLDRNVAVLNEKIDDILRFLTARAGAGTAALAAAAPGQSSVADAGDSDAGN